MPPRSSLRSKPQLHDRHLAPTLPHLLNPQPTPLHNRPQLIRRPLDPVDDTHHAQIPLVAVAHARALVCKQRGRGGGNGGVRVGERRDHELVAE